jgi:hypothetical protein
MKSLLRGHGRKAVSLCRIVQLVLDSSRGDTLRKRKALPQDRFAVIQGPVE